jgi:hypothetical protein
MVLPVHWIWSRATLPETATTMPCRRRTHPTRNMAIPHSDGRSQSGGPDYMLTRYLIARSLGHHHATIQQKCAMARARQDVGALIITLRHALIVNCVATQVREVCRRAKGSIDRCVIHNWPSAAYRAVGIGVCMLESRSSTLVRALRRFPLHKLWVGVDPWQPKRRGSPT